MQISLSLSEADSEAIAEFLEHTKNRFIDVIGNGPLTIEKLIEMLLKDVALSVRQPGSWEGGNMVDVLRGHGYCL